MTMRQAAINIPSVFINYFSISREAFTTNKKAQSKTNYDIYIFEIDLIVIFFYCFCPAPLKGKEI